ncbi:MAG: diguanylate cyclase [Magnetococcales bacterium]|nr:diguanylate cyclase [Magnetococcales bacterium]
MDPGTVLIVDDSADIRQMLALHLELAGYTVVQAENGPAALQYLEQNTPELMLLDWMMPGMEGPQVARSLRENAKNDSIYLIMLTAKGNTSDQITGLRTGIDLYVTKPFDPELLVVQIERGVDEARKRRQAVEDRNLAQTDALTGLNNRRAFDAALVRECDRAMRYKRDLVLVMMDLDHFKAVNDVFGHATGDRVLRELGQILRENSRESDLCFRYGGEEFALILPESNQEGAWIHIEKIRSYIEQHLFVGVGHKTASFGLAVLAEGESEESLLSRADAALYQSKQNGRNRITLAP